MWVRSFIFTCAVILTCVAVAAPSSRPQSYEELAASRIEATRKLEEEMRASASERELSVASVAQTAGQGAALVGGLAWSLVRAGYDLAATVAGGISSAVIATARGSWELVSWGKKALESSATLETAPPAPAASTAEQWRQDALMAARETGLDDAGLRVLGARSTADIKETDELALLGAQCGSQASSVASVNAGIVYGCARQVRLVREACSRSGADPRRSQRLCRKAAEDADDACEIDDTTEFFRELADACHGHAVARR